VPKIHPLPILILVISSIALISIATLFKKETTTENFFLGAKNGIQEIIEKDNPFEKFFAEKTSALGSRYAIYIKNLKNQKIYQLNSEEIFPAASLYKLAVLYSAYDKLEKGELKKTDILSANKSYLDKKLSEEEPDPEATLIPPEDNADVSMSVSVALRLMITISDNYAAILLSEKLGWKKMDDFLNDLGLTEIDLVSEGSPYTNAQIVGKILEKIYAGEAISAQASEEMKNLLLDQKINDRIPKYLPETVKVAHKTGELGKIRNDAGIIYGKKNDYIFVFLSETAQPIDAAETIANLSQKFYEELESN